MPEIGDAAALPASPVLADNAAEAARLLQICNACRYCEGFCAVFPAMTRRLDFHKADVDFLANLCHNCGACLHACQYAPPHDFAVNVPRVLARLRVDTYVDYAWPRSLGHLYRSNGLTVALALAGALALFLVLAAALNGPLWRDVASFYDVFPHEVMVAVFTPVFAFALVALGMGARRFWREAAPGRASAPAIAEATHDALTLRYLGGGHGDGCNDEDDRFTQRRRTFHHCAFYGFMLCFAATITASIYHYALERPAPYPLWSAPKMLGVAGGIVLLIGSVGLLWLNLRRHPLHRDPSQQPMDRAFIALLALNAITGLALLAVKHSPALPLALCIHLGAVLALFATLPYGKFAHGVYRTAALLKWSIERRQPSTIRLTED